MINKIIFNIHIEGLLFWKALLIVFVLVIIGIIRELKRGRKNI